MSKLLLSDNALARKALEEIHRIDEEAQRKKLAQLESLDAAKSAIVGRIAELHHQLQQIENTIGLVTGKPVHRGGREAAERRERRDHSADRQRVARWMEGRRGQKFFAGDLVREFPELEGTPISIFLKPLIAEGKIKTDDSHGARRLQYFA